MKSDVNEKIIRYSPNINTGLTSLQVKNRIDDNLLNHDTSIKTKSIKSIVASNVLTLFNFLNLFLGLSLICVGSSPKNMLFLLVVFFNTLIGTIQQINTKRIIDKLSIISSTKANVLRDKKEQKIPINEVVLDDIMILKQGDQISNDCIVMDGQCSVNESLITGESDSIHKRQGDMLLSGSYVVSGKCVAKVEHVGKNNYASKISNEAKNFKKVNSEIMSTFKRIILISSILIVPIGGLLFKKQLSIVDNSFKTAAIKTVAAMVGMIPEGLILLTSTVLAVSVIRLSKHNVMVQELYCIEMLARVDVLCLDKTGTITEGTMEVTDYIPFDGHLKDEVYQAVSSLVQTIEDTGCTFDAMKQKFLDNPKKKVIKVYPFSSEDKRSAITFEDGCSYIMGAAEFILKKDKFESIKDRIKSFSEENRVITVISTDQDIENGIPDKIDIIGVVLIKDRIRSTAKETLDFFASQDVDLKIISGDNVLTVSNIAKRAGLKNANKCIDATLLKTDKDIKKAVSKYSVFGRVTPIQKKKIVCALKENGHTVAMTGDGVNDVLALKEADCSVAMASGSDAARNVSQLVLLNSNFESMINVVKEGRRSINNIQRSSSLFLVKTIYSTVLAILFLFINMQYPFIPIQMTLLSSLTIGIPSFILAIEPNNERIKGKFFVNILSKSVPGALTNLFNIVLLILFKYVFNLQSEDISTMAVILTGFTGILILYRVSRPLNFLRLTLLTLVCLSLVFSVVFLKDIFSLTSLNLFLFILLLSMMAGSVCVFSLLVKLFNRRKS